MTVLVLCEELDLTADRVIAELSQRGVPVFRIDTAWFPTRLTLGADLGPDRWFGILRTPERDLVLTDVRSVWYRRPTRFRFPAGMSPPERQHAGWEAKFGLGGVLSTLPVRWVNHPHREADACYKPAQLLVAKRCGLAVPATIVTNDPDTVRRFAAQVKDGVVVKTLSTPVVLEQGGMTVAHTYRLREPDFADLSGLEVTAHLLQAWIGKSHEVRVTVVGDRLFPVAIEANTEAAKEDWRNDLGALRYRITDVPRPVHDGVSRYMSDFGLSYAAFDFVVDTKGCWWFLEANPGGQFGWLQAATGLPISAAVADLLERG